MDGQDVTLSSIPVMLIAVGRIYRQYLESDQYRKFTPVAMLLVAALLVVGINYGWENNLNVWQMVVYVIVYTISAILGYMTAKDQTTEETKIDKAK